jgi:hypothetical protein
MDRKLEFTFKSTLQMSNNVFEGEAVPEELPRYRSKLPNNPTIMVYYPHAPSPRLRLK